VHVGEGDTTAFASGSHGEVEPLGIIHSGKA
jgi:hypothetical protein